MIHFAHISFAFRFIAKKCSDYYNLLIRETTRRKSANPLPNIRVDKPEHSYKIRLDFGKKSRGRNKKTVIKQNPHAFTPLKTFEKLFPPTGDGEIRSFVFEQIGILSLPECPTKEQIKKWAENVSDFLFEIGLLSKSGRLADSTRLEIFSLFKSEMKTRYIELIDEDRFNPSLHRIVSTVIRTKSGHNVVKEKTSYGIKIGGIVFKKQEVIVYNQISNIK